MLTVDQNDDLVSQNRGSHDNWERQHPSVLECLSSKPLEGGGRCLIASRECRIEGCSVGETNQ